jgi:hypothetical protein
MRAQSMQYRPILPGCLHDVCMGEGENRLSSRYEKRLTRGAPPPRKVVTCSEAMERPTLNAALLAAGIADDLMRSDAQDAREFADHVSLILGRLKLLKPDSEVGWFISVSEPRGDHLWNKKITWFVSDGLNLLRIKPSLSYADLDIEVYRVVALSLKSVTATAFALQPLHCHAGSSLKYVFAVVDSTEDLQLVASGLNSAALESFVTTYLIQAETKCAVDRRALP